MARSATAKAAPGRAPSPTVTPQRATDSSPVRGERNCSVARTLDIVSDAWAFLIIREAFFGTRTFEAFRSALDIPRATLTQRVSHIDLRAGQPLDRPISNDSSAMVGQAAL